MYVVLVALALLSGAIATMLGFGFVDDADWLEDWPGWVSLTLSFFIAAHLPWGRKSTK